MIGCFYERGHWVALHLRGAAGSDDTVVVARLGDCPGDADGRDIELARRPTAGAALDRALHQLAAGWRHAGDSRPHHRQRPGAHSPNRPRSRSKRAPTPAAGPGTAIGRAAPSRTPPAPTDGASASSATPLRTDTPAGHRSDHIPTSHTPHTQEDSCPSHPLRSASPRTRRPFTPSSSATSATASGPSHPTCSPARSRSGRTTCSTRPASYAALRAARTQ